MFETFHCLLLLTLKAEEQMVVLESADFLSWTMWEPFAIDHADADSSKEARSRRLNVSFTVSLSPGARRLVLAKAFSSASGFTGMLASVGAFTYNCTTYRHETLPVFFTVAEIVYTSPDRVILGFE